MGRRTDNRRAGGAGTLPLAALLLQVLLLSTGATNGASTGPPELNATLTATSGQRKHGPGEPPALTLVIDAGHGGKDRGCAGHHSNEKVISLAVARAFGRLVEQRRPDVRVLYTRYEDVFVPLHERAAIANRARADLFISIHCNYLVSSAAVNGSETFVMGLNTVDYNLDVAKRENAAIRMEDTLSRARYGFDPETPAGHIILSMYQHAFLEQSTLLAESLERNLRRREGRKSRGVQQAAFVVLKETAMPSVLIETGYLSNASEEDYLTSPAGQQQTAEALYRGLVGYLRQRGASGGAERAVLAKAETTAAAYFVQLATSDARLDTSTEAWEQLGSRFREVKLNDDYSYLIGPYASRREAQWAARRAATTGFAEASVVIYRGEETGIATETSRFH